MRQPLEENHLLDAQRRPAGGSTIGRGLIINWQEGPLAVDGERRDPNGCFVETVIAAALGRLRFYQTDGSGWQEDGKLKVLGTFACHENDMAITKLEEALHWLDHRTRERERRGVEGTHTP